MATSTDVLDVAARLARGGRHDAALSLLDALPADPPASEPDLLRAKILAQKKDFEGAAALWRRVLESSPDHEEARRGMAAAESLRRRPRLLVFWRAKAAAAALVLLSGTGLLAAAGRQPDASVEAGEDLPVEVRQIGEIRRLRQELEEARGRLAAESEPEPPPVLDFGLPGTSVREDENAVVIGFDEGLFDHGAVLRPGAAPLLAGLAERLAAAAEPISIRVVGHTDHLPVPEGSVYLDNEALGLARAAAVIGELREAARLPGTIFEAASLGASRGPGPRPDAGPAYRPRERTVTILVRHRGR